MPTISFALIRLCLHSNTTFKKVIYKRRGTFHIQRNMVWDNLCEFTLVNIKAMNEVVHSRKVPNQFPMSINNRLTIDAISLAQEKYNKYSGI